MCNCAVKVPHDHKDCTYQVNNVGVQVKCSEVLRLCLWRSIGTPCSYRTQYRYLWPILSDSHRFMLTSKMIDFSFALCKLQVSYCILLYCWFSLIFIHKWEFLDWSCCSPCRLWWKEATLAMVPLMNVGPLGLISELVAPSYKLIGWFRGVGAWIN